jgi:hypothetical protein
MLITSKLYKALAGLHTKFTGQAEDAYVARDAANQSSQYEAESYAAGEAHAYGQAAESIRAAQNEAADEFIHPPGDRD